MGISGSDRFPFRYNPLKTGTYPLQWCSVSCFPLPPSIVSAYPAFPYLCRQTLLYDLYSKDVSVKVKASFENKCANGEFSIFVPEQPSSQNSMISYFESSGLWCMYSKICFLLALNDHYDSREHHGSTIEIDTAFQTLLYDLYSKDVSSRHSQTVLTAYWFSDRFPICHFSKIKTVIQDIPDCLTAPCMKFSKWRICFRTGSFWVWEKQGGKKYCCSEWERGGNCTVYLFPRSGERWCAGQKQYADCKAALWGRCTNNHADPQAW